MSLDRASADRLSEYLDAIVNGDARRSDGLDPVSIAAVERFFVGDDAPGPPPGLAEHLWQELDVRSAMEKTVPLVPAARPERNGHAPAPPRQIASAQRGSTALAFFATAALIALTLIGGVLVSRGTFRLVRSEERAAITPAADNTPEHWLPSEGIADTTLVQAMLDDLPDAAQAGQLALNRYQLAPGATQPFGRQADSGVSLDVFIVEAGQVTVEADAPVKVTRAGAEAMSAPSLIEPGTAIVLDVGDQLHAPPGVTFRRRNDGATTATTLDFSIGAIGDARNTPSLPAGVTIAANFPSKQPGTVPTAPAEATVQRLTLPPGSELAVRDIPGLELVYVESGTLELTDDGAGDPAPATESVTIRAGRGTAEFGGAPDQAVLANRGAEPLVILTASLVPANVDQATPPQWSDGWGSGDHQPE